MRYCSSIDPSYSVLVDSSNRFVVSSSYLPIKYPDFYCSPLENFITKNWIAGGYLGDIITFVGDSTRISRTFNDNRKISYNIATTLHDLFGKNDKLSSLKK